jgi:hypothetical protein
MQTHSKVDQRFFQAKNSVKWTAEPANCCGFQVCSAATHATESNASMFPFLQFLVLQRLVIMYSIANAATVCALDCMCLPTDVKIVVGKMSMLRGHTVVMVKGVREL